MANKPNKAYFITDCSESALKGSKFCEFSDKNDMGHHRYENEEGVLQYHYFCPEHGGPLVQKKTTCIDCKEFFYFAKSTSYALRCKKCKDKHREKKVREYERNRALKKALKDGALIAEGKINVFLCKYFDTICGLCIRPWFNYRMFKPQKIGSN